LLPGEALTSINGNFQFENTTTGSLVLFDTSNAQQPKPIWKLDMGAPGRLIMQSDNNLVFYNNRNQPLWATNTGVLGHNSYFMLVNDGSLALYNMDTNERFHTVYQPAGALVALDGVDAVPSGRRQLRGGGC